MEKFLKSLTELVAKHNATIKASSIRTGDGSTRDRLILMVGDVSLCLGGNSLNARTMIRGEYSLK